MKDKNEIILYQPDESLKIDVRIDADTVWLTQAQMVELFQRDVSVISRHISNIFKEGELGKKSNLHFLQIPFSDKPLTLYSLDVIISVGYRVKSQRGTQFRIWANQILKDYLLKGYAISSRIDLLEKKVFEHDKKFDLLVKTAIPPKEGIFFEGQIFDAYTFVADLIRAAHKSIILIDNYIDDTVLILLAKRSKGVDAKIITKHISEGLKADLLKYKQQYPAISILENRHFHDRFLIIDSVIYHIGASLKDLGKKLFAFSKMEIESSELLKSI